MEDWGCATRHDEDVGRRFHHYGREGEHGSVDEASNFVRMMAVCSVSRTSSVALSSYIGKMRPVQRRGNCWQRYGLAAALLGVMAAPATAEAPRPVVAVLGLQNEGAPLKKPFVNRMSAYISVQLVSSGRYAAVPNDAVKRALSEKKAESYRECYAESCQIEIGQEVAASKVLSGKILKAGERCIVTLSLFDLRKAAQERAATGRGACSEGGVLASIDAAFRGLVGGSRTRTAPSSLNVPAIEAPDYGDPDAELREQDERIRAAADKAAREAARAAAAKKARELAAEKDWKRIQGWLRNDRLPLKRRIGILKKHLSTFDRDNPREAEARAVLAKLESKQRPPWATAMGRDRFGTYADVIIPGTQAKFRMRWIEPGTFVMGSPNGEEGRDSDEGPRHKVTLRQGFWMADSECTQAVYEAVMGTNPSDFKGADRPVEQVSWNEVQAFLTKLNALVPGPDFRLPTEAEWEYAARAGTTKARYGALDAIAWRVGGETHPVKRKQPNAWGLYDMLGNIWEWCADWYGSYDSGHAYDPIGPTEGTYRVLRGGGWFSPARSVRAAFRDRVDPSSRHSSFGFRLSRGQAAPGGPEGQ